ncbi:MAG: class I SAM-dependent methyltransferase [Acidimicrobiales bacterium]|nr:class I SAM-dependent methyltransferase [Acidimicrobiales bacterium]
MDNGQERFYGELATWWPLISPVSDYEEESGEIERHLRSASIGVADVLELGSGGGHVAYWLKRSFRLTLVDLSPAMLAVSASLNPECEHHTGDMTSVRLGRSFDAVLIHDAVDYLTTEDQIVATLRTAYEHCRPGGILVVLPDHTRETFEPATDHGGSDGPDGRGVRFLEWSTDPDPQDTTVRTDYAFLLRDEHGEVRVVHDVHVTGLFPQATWLRLLADAGFRSEARTEHTTEDREPRTVFVGHRPTAPSAR